MFCQKSKRWSTLGLASSLQNSIQMVWCHTLTGPPWGNVGQLENNGLCGQPLFGTCIEFGVLPELLGEPLSFLTRQTTLWPYLQNAPLCQCRMVGLLHCVSICPATQDLRPFHSMTPMNFLRRNLEQACTEAEAVDRIVRVASAVCRAGTALRLRTVWKKDAARCPFALGQGFRPCRAPILLHCSMGILPYLTLNFINGVTQYL